MKCPYCFRNLNPATWHKDPILLPNGSKYKWADAEETILEIESDIGNRQYIGTYQIGYEEVKEIQDVLKTLEDENLPVGERTVFSPLNESGYFQITGFHIKEMRDSVEKLLIQFGLDKISYFNTDEAGLAITRPEGDKIEWTDPITDATDLKQFQVKYIHIEELRHNIQSFWLEDWSITPDEVFFNRRLLNISGEYGENILHQYFTGDKLGLDGWYIGGFIKQISPSGVNHDSNIYADIVNGRISMVCNTTLSEPSSPTDAYGVTYFVLDPSDFEIPTKTYIKYNNNLVNSHIYIYGSYPVIDANYSGLHSDNWALACVSVLVIIETDASTLILDYYQTKGEKDVSGWTEYYKGYLWNDGTNYTHNLVEKVQYLANGQLIKKVGLWSWSPLDIDIVTDLNTYFPGALDGTANARLKRIVLGGKAEAASKGTVGQFNFAYAGSAMENIQWIKLQPIKQSIV